MPGFAHAKQLIESKATSLNQVPATFNRAEFRAGESNLDYGGGKYDQATEALAAKGARNLVFDPFNRGAAHNLRARLAVARMGGAHTATVNNVLNVIAEGEAIDQVVQQAANGIKPDGRAHFLIHEGDRSGVGRATSRGWQRNEKTELYMDAIRRRFGSATRKGNLITASKPMPSADSLFCLVELGREILATAKSLGVPMPSAKHGVGKSIGGCLYLHRSAWDALPEAILEAALSRAPAGFEPAIAKWEPRTGCVSLIESRGFDSEREPAIQNAIKVFPDGTTSSTRAKADPQIYHHKWNFVRPGYAGFDYLDNAIRSIEWAQIPCDRSRIGTRSHWESEVLWKSMGGSGAVGPDPRAAIAGPAAKKGKAAR